MGALFEQVVQLHDHGIRNLPVAEFIEGARLYKKLRERFMGEFLLHGVSRAKALYGTPSALQVRLSLNAFG